MCNHHHHHHIVAVTVALFGRRKTTLHTFATTPFERKMDERNGQMGQLCERCYSQLRHSGARLQCGYYDKRTGRRWPVKQCRPGSGHTHISRGFAGGSRRLGS